MMKLGCSPWFQLTQRLMSPKNAYAIGSHLIPSHCTSFIMKVRHVPPQNYFQGIGWMLFESERLEKRNADVWNLSITSRIDMYIFYDDERNPRRKKFNTSRRNVEYGVVLFYHTVLNELCCCCVSLSFIKHSSGYDTFIIYY